MLITRLSRKKKINRFFSILFFLTSLSVSLFLKIQSETRFCICYSLCYSLRYSSCYSLRYSLLLTANHYYSLLLLLFTIIITINDRFYSLSGLRQRWHYHWQKKILSSLSLLSSVSLSLFCIIIITFFEFICLFKFSFFKCFLEKNQLETNCQNINNSHHVTEN